MKLKPKLFSTLARYDRSQFLKDLQAGIIVAFVAVPLALAFAIASGVAPQQGLYTAIIAGFIISALGGSRVQIGGPTGAFVVIVYGIVQQYGLDGLAVCTVMAGLFLIAMGLMRMGALIKFIPYPVITGFTSGIAVIIFSSQIKDLLGLQMGAVPAHFVEKWVAYFHVIGTISWPTAALSAATLLLMYVWPKITKVIPAPIVVLVAVSAAAKAFQLPVETIESRFGPLPAGLPSFTPLDAAWRELPRYVQPAMTIALLAAIESLLSAVVADGMIGGRHRSDMELIAQGAANVASPLFGGIPATGAIARTATNVKFGGRTPVSGITHAAALALILVFFGRWVQLVPLAVLAAILVVVSYHMSEWRTFASLMRAPKSDVAVLLATFLLTILVDLTVAVEVGMVLSAFLFMRRMAEATSIKEVSLELSDGGPSESQRRPHDVPREIEVYDINGPFFFGAADKLGSTLTHIRKPPKALVLRMKHVPVLDATGLKALLDLQSRCRRERTHLILAGVQPSVMNVLRDSGHVSGFDKIMTDTRIDHAIKTAGEVIRMNEAP